MLEKIISKYKNNISGIIQVGANIGQELRLLSSIEKNLYLFEPLKIIFRQLEDNIKEYNNTAIFNLALGDRNKTENIYVADNNHSVSSSILEPSLHLKYFPEVIFKKKERITVKRFDSIEQEFKANFLILDVQGFELKVIEGFGKKISQIDYIFTEFSLEKLYKNSVTLKELEINLSNLGYIRTKTKLASNKPQGDAFFVKKSNLNRFIYFYYLIKAKLQIGKLYLLFNFLLDFKKVKYVLKNKLLNS